MNILVVDDQADQGESLVQLLNDRGHEAEWTVCLVGARAKVSLRSYDAVVADLVVGCLPTPQFMDGLNQLPVALVILAPVPPGHPILTHVPDRAKVLYQPVDPEEIVRAVESLAPVTS